MYLCFMFICDIINLQIFLKGGYFMALNIKQNDKQLKITINGDTIIINKGCPDALRQSILDQAGKQLDK